MHQLFQISLRVCKIVFHLAAPGFLIRRLITLIIRLAKISEHLRVGFARIVLIIKLYGERKVFDHRGVVQLIRFISLRTCQIVLIKQSILDVRIQRIIQRRILRRHTFGRRGRIGVRKRGRNGFSVLGIFQIRGSRIQQRVDFRLLLLRNIRCILAGRFIQLIDLRLQLLGSRLLLVQFFADCLHLRRALLPHCLDSGRHDQKRDCRRADNQADNAACQRRGKTEAVHAGRSCPDRLDDCLVVLFIFDNAGGFIDLFLRSAFGFTIRRILPLLLG